MKKILVLTGSPRKNGNSDMMADAFIRGAKSKGHEVMRFDAGRAKIGGCKACDNCWSKGDACVFRDGFAELEPLLESADTIVFVTPVYWFTMSAQLKCAIDRFYAYFVAHSKIKLKITESLLLACAADDDTNVFNGLLATYNLMIDFNGWKNAGILTAPSVYDKGDILKTVYLKKSEDLGRLI